MSFHFSLLCDLLNMLDRARARRNSRRGRRTVASNAQIITAWFKKHQQRIPRGGQSAVAFLSCLFPERRPDRVYELQEKRLESVIQRSQCLGHSRLRILQAWRTRNGADFPSCVEHVMLSTDAEPKPGPPLTLEEINETLDRIGALSAFSSENLRAFNAKYSEPLIAADALISIFRRVNSSEAKWLTRMLLKSYGPLQIPEKVALRQFHPMIPRILMVQNSLDAACRLLTERKSLTTDPKSLENIDVTQQFHMHELVPQTGIMIARPKFEKARSIQHCCRLADGKRLSIERKYDGEYCQVHIDLTNGSDNIRLFSKSGRDSTSDRIGLHDTLRTCLRLGRVDCIIKRFCILEGELLVWNDQKQRIEQFHKIRKHVQRAGRYIGTTQDPPADPNEHLMIVFYDILLLDDAVCIWEPLSARRERLQSMVRCISGRADLGTYEILEFRNPNAAHRLSEVFACAITQRWEGLVLKAYDGPYLSFCGKQSHIKLKKDYIPGLGDTVDFVIIGGRRDAKVEQELRIGKLWWSSFYIACLLNKDEVCRFDVKPKFIIVDCIGHHGISKRDMLFLSRHGYFRETPFSPCIPEFHVELDSARLPIPTDLFKDPFVVELVGAGFDKPADCRYYTLRFPRIQKIHQDRTFKDAVSFNEMQELAKRSTRRPEEEWNQEQSAWLQKLEPRVNLMSDSSQDVTCTSSD